MYDILLYIPSGNVVNCCQDSKRLASYIFEHEIIFMLKSNSHYFGLPKYQTQFFKISETFHYSCFLYHSLPLNFCKWKFMISLSLTFQQYFRVSIYRYGSNDTKIMYESIFILMRIFLV